MKKLTVMTIVLAMLLALATVVCAAEVTAEAGETVTVEFELNPTLVKADYTITYDSSKLEYVSKSVTPANGRDERTAGKVEASFYGADSNAKISAKFIVKEALKEGEATDVKLSVVKAYGASSDDPVADVTDTVTVKIPETTPTETTPTETTPTETTPTETTPTETTPTETTPTETTPTETTPTETAPTETTPTEVTPTEKDDKTKFDPTGISVAYVGIIALVVLAGAVVLIKRK